MSSIPTLAGATGPASTPKVPAAALVELPAGIRLTIQVNFCKNPRCANFGVPPSLAKGVHRSKSAAGTPGIAYTLSGAGGSITSKSTLKLRCDLCGELPPIKSNEGIVEDLKRISRDAKEPSSISCPDPACVNHRTPFSKARYVGYGKNAQGSERWKCRACEKTFAVPTRTTIRQRQPKKNVVVYRLLVNKSPISRICEVADIAPKTFYDKLTFIHQRSVAFAGKFDRLIPALDLKRLYIAVDRQDYIVNWAGRKDKRNVTLQGLGSADLVSGFVFGMHLNFDAQLDSSVVEADAKATGDAAKEPPLRKYSWLLLEADYAANTEEAARRREARGVSSTLADDIAAVYAEAAVRGDVEEAQALSSLEQLPRRGMQVRVDYTLYAHFLWLKALLQERFDAYAAAHPGLPADQVRLEMMKEEIRKATAYGKWSDRWVVHPWPSMAEPEKALCHLTDMDDLDEDHLAHLYFRGSLHAIDRFFMLLRRRVSLLERSISTSSKAGRSWYGYSAYNPGNVQKVLDVFRTFYNFCLVGRDDKTPAMRLGLAARAYAPSDILNFGATAEMKRGPGGVRRSPQRSRVSPALPTD